MNVSIPPAAADEAGRLADLSDPIELILLAVRAERTIKQPLLGSATVAGLYHALGLRYGRGGFEEAVRAATNEKLDELCGLLVHHRDELAALAPAGRLVPATPIQSEDAVELMREALEFYRDNWKGNADGDLSEAHLTRVWRDPTDALYCDAGRKASDALAILAATPTPPAPSRDLVEALIRAVLTGYADWQVERMLAVPSSIPAHEQKVIAALTAALAATQAPAEPSQNGPHPATVDLVDRFAAALKAKLKRAEDKYGYSDHWADPSWQAKCQQDLAGHVSKGDPLDVAAYAAFCWHHGWPTTASAPAEPSQGAEAAKLREALANAAEILEMQGFFKAGGDARAALSQSAGGR